MTLDTRQEPARSDEVGAVPNPVRPLKGIFVLDFSKILAGPLCTQYLGELGATVVKIEAIGVGDDTRHWPPFTDNEGTVYLSVNRNKRSLAVDLRSAEGLRLCHRLAKQADIAIENFSPGAAERLGIGYAALSELNPRLIYCSISGYGSVGPRRSHKGYDVILQAFSGMLSITGESGGPPVRAPYSPVDQGTGLHAAIGILAGLLQRGQTGTGMKVEASLFDTSLSFLAPALQAFWERREDPKPAGSGHESLCPYQAFETADLPLLLGVANDALWRRFSELVGQPGLAHSPKFATGAQRVAHRDETVALVQAILIEKPRAVWIEAFEAAGVPCSPIHTISELTADPHAISSEMMFRYDSFGLPAAMGGVAIPLRLNGERLTPQLAPPRLGEHSAVVLREFGLTDAEISSLVAAEVVSEGGGSR